MRDNETGGQGTKRAGQPGNSLRLRRKPGLKTPLVRVSWPSQPVLGSLDFDDETEGA